MTVGTANASASQAAMGPRLVRGPGCGLCRCRIWAAAAYGPLAYREAHAGRVG